MPSSDSPEITSTQYEKALAAETAGAFFCVNCQRTVTPTRRYTSGLPPERGSIFTSTSVRPASRAVKEYRTRGCSSSPDSRICPSNLNMIGSKAAPTMRYPFSKGTGQSSTIRAPTSASVENSKPLSNSTIRASANKPLPPPQPQPHKNNKSVKMTHFSPAPLNKIRLLHIMEYCSNLL